MQLNFKFQYFADVRVQTTGLGCRHNLGLIPISISFEKNKCRWFDCHRWRCWWMVVCDPRLVFEMSQHVSTLSLKVGSLFVPCLHPPDRRTNKNDFFLYSFLFLCLLNPISTSAFPRLDTSLDSRLLSSNTSFKVENKTWVSCILPIGQLEL